MAIQHAFLVYDLERKGGQSRPFDSLEEARKAAPDVQHWTPTQTGYQNAAGTVTITRRRLSLNAIAARYLDGREGDPDHDSHAPGPR